MAQAVTAFCQLPTSAKFVPGLKIKKGFRPLQYKGMPYVTSGVLQHHGETLAQKTLTHTKRGFDEGCCL